MITSTDLKKRFYFSAAYLFKPLIITFAVLLMAAPEMRGEHLKSESEKCANSIDPIAICVDFNTFLDYSGTKAISPLNVDGGSNDPDGEIVNYSVEPNFFTCDDLGVNVVTLTVEDNDGNTASCTANVTVTFPSQTISCYSEIHLSLDVNGNGTLTPDEVLAGPIFDPCDLFTVTPSDYDCSDIGSPISATVQDGTGNFCWFTVIVEDKIPPEFIWPDDVTIECGGNTDPEILGEPVIIDNCGLFGTSYEDQIFNLVGDNIKILRTWTIIDWITGDTVDYIQVITTTDITEPTAICLAAINVYLDQYGMATIPPEVVDAGSYDDCGDVTLSLSPSSFDCSDIGETITVVLTVTDESGNVNQCFSEVLIEDKMAPTAVCVAQLNLSLDVDGIGVLTPSAVDGGSYDNCGPLSFELSQDTFTCADIGDPILVLMTVTDASGNSNQCFTEVLVEDKLGPNVVCPADVTVDCSLGTEIDPQITGYPTVTDNCDLIGYAYEDLILPIGGPNFKILRTWTVVDWYSGISVECVQVINVFDITPPEMVCVTDLVAALGNDGTLTLFPEDFDAGTTDDCGTVTLELSQSQFDCTDIGENVVWLTAYDDSQNQNQCFANLIIQDNTAPTAVCIDQVNVSLDADGNAVITPDVIDAGSTDNCGPLTFELSEDTFDCSDIGEPIIITMTVTDGSGNSNQCFSTVVIEDKLGPAITCPDDVTIECAFGPNPDPALTGSPTVSDNCDLLGIAYEDDVLQLEGANYKILRKWQVVDWYSGLTAECYQVIKVEDITPPNAICIDNVSASLDADGNLTVFAEDFDAGSYDDCGEVTLSINQSQFDCDDVGENVITLTVEDENENVSQCVSTLVIFGFDGDDDGFSVCDGDCNDNDASISPGAQEVCNDNIDNNCDGQVDENCLCASFAESTQYEWIESITANGTTNTSGDDGGYGDYTGVNIPLDVGANTLQLIPGFSGSSYNEYWTIWIDLNQNGMYEFSEEVFSDNSFSTINGTLTIPPSAFLGTTTMRISMQYATPAGPCEIFDEGEVEDYTVIISEPPFCNSQAQNTQYEWIKKVRLKSINNNSGNNNGYADFTYLSTNLNPGQSKKINLKPGFSGSSYNEYWRVWVDWNEDGDFDDPNELEVQTASSGNTSGFVTVPNSASSGNKIMRVSMKYGGYPEPCEIFTYGEVEDYTIFITGNNPLVGQEQINEYTYGTKESVIVDEINIETRSSELETNVSVYPNPASTAIHLNLNGFESGMKSLKMYNQTGQLVVNQNFNQDSYTIDILSNNLLPGIHIVVIQQGEKTFTERIIIVN